MEPYAEDKKEKKKRINFRFIKDGLLLEGLEETSAAAMSTSIMSISERVIKELNAGELKHIFIEGSDGILMFSNNEENAIFRTHSKERSEITLYCKYCGCKLEKDQKICRICGKMVV